MDLWVELMTFVPLWLKNQFFVNLFHLLGPNIEMKFHQDIENCRSLHSFHITIRKNILLNIPKHNTLDFLHSEGYSDWLASC